MKINFKNICSFLCSACTVLILSGCATTNMQDASQKTPIEQAQDYVVAIDSHAADISKKADEYIETLGKSDSVAAKLKLEEITSALDECANVEIPEVLKDEGEKYKQACNDLKDSLTALGSVAEGKTNSDDAKTSVDAVQQKYSSAAQNLADADKALLSKLDELKLK